MEWQIENHCKKIKKLETDSGDFAYYIRKNNVEITRYFQKLADMMLLKIKFNPYDIVVTCSNIEAI